MTTSVRKAVCIGDRVIGDGYPVAVVAELGVNHLGDLSKAKEMVSAAHEAGADFVKLQTYEAESRYDPKTNPKGRQFIDLTAKWELSKDEQADLWEYAKNLGAQVFTSPFDENSVDFADSLGSQAYKIAAFELVNLKLITKIAQKGKPVIYSCGMASLEEIYRCNQILDSFQIPYIALHTVSSYPLERRFSELRKIHHLRAILDCPVGHSDHTPGSDIPPLAVAAGANMIEKHFTITPKLRESDNFFSVTPDELRDLIYNVRKVEVYMGAGEFAVHDTELYMHDFRRYTDV